MNEGMRCPPDHPPQCMSENCEPAGPWAPLLGVAPYRVSRPEAGLLPRPGVAKVCGSWGKQDPPVLGVGSHGGGVQAPEVGDRRREGGP